MESSPLVRLPAELRNQIFADALQAPGHIRLCFSYERPHDAENTQDHRSNRLSLTLTCKQIREESCLLFFAANSFVFCGPPGIADAALHKFLAIIGEQGAHSLRSVTLIMEYLTDLLDPDPEPAELFRVLCWLNAFAVQHPRCRTRFQIPLFMFDYWAVVDMQDTARPWPTAIRWTAHADIFHEDEEDVEDEMTRLLEKWRMELQKPRPRFLMDD